MNQKFINKMSCIINTNLYEDNILFKLQKELTKHIEPENKQYSAQSKTVHLYSVDPKGQTAPGYQGVPKGYRPCNIPFNYGLQLKNIKIERPNRNTLSKLDCGDFEGTLRDEQKNCRNQALTILQKSKCAILSCYTGFGKTVTAINMANKIKFKTFIMVPKKALLKQWESEIKLFLPRASVLVVDPAKVKDLDTSNIPDFCIINACNVSKIDKNFLKCYGFVVVDEVHLCMTEKLSENLLLLTPRYLLGISATPYRKDGYNCFFRLFFGTETVKYELNKKHIVYKIITGFKPKEKNKDFKNKLDWNYILDEQSKDEKRNRLIVQIVTRFKDRVFLILVKRVEHGLFLLRELEKHGEKVTSLLGKQQEFDKEARILVGTNSKIGTGFDHPRLDTLLAAADMVSYYIQFMGRIMRRKDVQPIIFDLVDSHPTLKKHFEKRSKVYTKHGGEIIKFSESLLC